MKKKLFKNIFFSLIIFMSIPISVSAYKTFAFNTLLSGIYDKYYTVPSNAIFKYSVTQTTKDYGYFIRNGVRGWNETIDYISPDNYEDVYFTETTNKSLSTVDYAVNEFGTSVGWRGLCQFYSTSGAYIIPDYYSWYYCVCSLNVTSMHTSLDIENIATAAHEFGHALGLDHPTNTYDCVMKKEYVNRPARPTVDDVAGIRLLY